MPGVLTREADVRVRFETLVGLFPSIANAPGANPWNALAFEKWACGPAPGSGALAAARFVLSVWNPQQDWRCGRFDVHEAMSGWDYQHCDAFLLWAIDPFWP